MTKFITTILLFSSVAVAQYQPQEPSATKTLKYVSDTFIKKDGSSKTKFHIIKNVATDAGRMEVALTKVNFIKSLNSFKLIEAYSLTNKIKSDVEEKKIIIRSADTVKYGISDVMEAIIPFENVNVGSEVHLIYELSAKPRIGKYFSDTLLITNETLAKEERYYFTSEVPLKMEQIDFHPYFHMFPLKTSEGLHGFGIEPNAAAYQAEGVDVQNSTFVVTTVPSWEELRKSESQNYEPELKKDLPKKYESILKSAKTLTNPKDIIEHVAHELSKAITYSGDWQTQSGKFVPQPMQTVALKGRGDCKDYSTAMIAILRKLDFTAYPFLTFRSLSYAGPTKLKAYAKLPNPNFFNHVIVHAKDKTGKTWWVDPTNPYVQADSITSDILGNFGLILDDKSTDVTFLPDKNPQPANLSLMRSVVIEADDSINGKAILSMTASSHNTFGMVERMHGTAGLAKTLGFLLNPSLKTTKVEIKKSDIKEHKYEFDFIANDWVVDQKKLKLLILVNPLAFLADRIGLKKDIDIGEPGLTKIVTRIKKQKVEDTVAAGCLVRSTWFNFDRIVENTPDALIVTDELNVKKRFIAKEESQGKEYESLLGDIGDCVRGGSTLFIHMDPSLKSPDDIAQEKKNGPLLEVMTDKQADDYYNSPRSEKSNFLRTKLVRFYQNKLKKEQTASTYRKVGHLIVNLGYISGNTFGSGYMEDGLEYYKKALPLATGAEKDEILAELIEHKVDAGKVSEAVAQFNEYYKNNSRKFKSFELASMIALAQDKDKEAESWLKAGEKFAITKDEKVNFNKTMQDILWRQKKYAESIPYQEKVLALVPDGWNYHNLAILYFETKNFDKVIELENKALSLKDFGMARYMISRAYTEKFILNSQIIHPRSPASDEEAINFLLQAIKYDSQNINALSSMAMFQAKEFIKKKDKTTLTKGKGYLEQAIQLDPNHFKVRQGMKIFKDLEDGKPVPDAIVHAFMTANFK